MSSGAIGSILCVATKAAAGPPRPSWAVALAAMVAALAGRVGVAGAARENAARHAAAIVVIARAVAVATARGNRSQGALVSAVPAVPLRPARRRSKRRVGTMGPEPARVPTGGGARGWTRQTPSTHRDSDHGERLLVRQLRQRCRRERERLLQQRHVARCTTCGTLLVVAIHKRPRRVVGVDGGCCAFRGDHCRGGRRGWREHRPVCGRRSLRDVTGRDTRHRRGAEGGGSEGSGDSGVGEAGDRWRRAGQRSLC